MLCLHLFALQLFSASSEPLIHLIYRLKKNDAPRHETLHKYAQLFMSWKLELVVPQSPLSHNNVLQ